MLQETKDYLNKLPSHTTERFTALPTEDQDKAVFQANENLYDHYLPSRVTARAVALQVLYEVEGEEERYSNLKRHGVTSAGSKDTSLSFQEGQYSVISPQVITILGMPRKRGGAVGRLV